MTRIKTTEPANKYIHNEDEDGCCGEGGAVCSVLQVNEVESQLPGQVCKVAHCIPSAEHNCNCGPKQRFMPESHTCCGVVVTASWHVCSSRGLRADVTDVICLWASKVSQLSARKQILVCCALRHKLQALHSQFMVQVDGVEEV